MSKNNNNNIININNVNTKNENFSNNLVLNSGMITHP